MIAAFALAAAMGMLLGLLGGGGSILTVPIFVYVLGVAAKPAIAMSLPVVGATSLVGAVRHWRDGNVDFRVALPFGAVAMTGAYGGARLATLVRGPAQLLLLGAVMLAAAVAMLRGSGAEAPPSEPSGADSPSRRTFLLLVGLGVGVLTGLVGVGGGFLIVPALVLLAGMRVKRAIGTSLVVIAMNSASGFFGYAGDVDVDWHVVVPFTAVAVGGILVGTRVVRHASAGALRRAFGVLLLGMGAFVLWQNRAAL